MTTPYSALEVERGIWQLWDPVGVGMTLFVGAERALLFDAGYGLWDLGQAVRAITDKPLSLVLSHAHHDHVLGALRLGMAGHLRADDLGIWDHYTSRAIRQRILQSAQDKGLELDQWAQQHYVDAPVPAPCLLEEDVIELGSLSLRVIDLPGHTPGSIGLYAQEQRLLAMADSWNPQTWVFFQECSPLSVYQSSLHSLKALPAEQVLVSHDLQPRSAALLHAYIEGLSDELLDRAEPWPMAGYEDINTHRCFPLPDSPLMFDRNKWRKF